MVTNFGDFRTIFGDEITVCQKIRCLPEILAVGSGLKSEKGPDFSEPLLSATYCLLLYEVFIRPHGFPYFEQFRARYEDLADGTIDPDRLLLG